MDTTKQDTAIREAQARRERTAYAMQYAKQAARWEMEEQRICDA